MASQGRCITCGKKSEENSSYCFLHQVIRRRMWRRAYRRKVGVPKRGKWYQEGI